MASPARTVDAGDTILEVHHTLTRSNINAVPVMRSGKVAGILTRQWWKRPSTTAWARSGRGST